jgi:hypothetical protein
MADKRKLTVVLAGDAKGLERVFGSAGKATRGFGSAVAKTAKIAAASFAAVGIGAVAVGKQAIDAASDLGESLSKVNVVFGDNAAEVRKWAQGSAKAFGQSQQQALEAAGTYGNLFQAFGVGRKESTKMSKSLVELAADLASFNNTSVDDALQALQSGLSGETEPLKRFGVALSDARLKDEALRMGLIKTTKDALTPGAKAQASYALIMKDTTLAQGDFGRTSDGLANKQRIFAARIQDLKAKLGQGLLPVVSAVTGFLSDRLVPAFEKVSKFAGMVGGALQGALSGDGITSNGLVGKVERIGVAVRNVALAISGWIDEVKPKIQAWVDDVLREMGEWWDDHGPTVIAIVVGIKDAVVEMAEQVVRKVQWLHRNWDDLRTPLAAIATFITAVFIPHWIALGVAAVVSSVKQAAAWAATKAKAIAAAMAHSAHIAVMVAKWIWLGATAMAQAAIIAAAWLLSLGPIAWIVAAVIAAVGLIIYHWGTIKDAAAAVFNWVRDNWPLLLAILTGPFGVAVYLIARNWQTIKDGAGAAVGWVRDRFGELVGFFTSMPGRISGAVHGMFDGIKDAFKGAVNWVIRKWNDLSFGIEGPSVFGKKLPSVNIDTPNIPEMRAMGGAVTAGRPYWVGELGRPELFVPRQSGEIVPDFRMSGGDTHYHFPNYVGNRDELVRAMDWRDRQSRLSTAGGRR